MNTLEDTLAPLAARLTHIAEQRRPLDDEEAAIKERIKTIVPGPDRYAAGTLTITVSPNRRFDPVLAETTLPVDVLAACQVTRIDPAKAKQILPPALYDQCLVDTGYRITVR